MNRIGYYFICCLFCTCFATLQAEIPFYLQDDINSQNNINREYKVFKSYVNDNRSIDRHHKVNAVQASKIYFRNYDVIRYQINLDWYNPLTAPTTLLNDRNYTGNVKITFMPLEDNIQELVFDAGQNLKITAVKDSNDNTLEFEHSVQTESLKIKLKETLMNKKGSYITIYYQDTSTQNSYTELGFYLFDKGEVGGKLPGDTVPYYNAERIAYTMSEPQGARQWFVCNDHPYDKALSEIIVRVPKGYTVASNGINIASMAINDTSVFEFQSFSPMSTYLFNVVASKFYTFNDAFYPNGDTSKAVPIDYYVWAEDFDGTQGEKKFNAQKSFEKMTLMMEKLSQKLYDYPFEKYGMVAISPFAFGGMEHQTMTSINRSWLNTNAESGIAHELAHHWFGDFVTCGTWSDLWFNEGGATWSESLWRELDGNKELANYYVYANNRNYLLGNGSLKMPSMYDILIGDSFGAIGWYLVYQKAGFFYHSLRQLLGDEAFFSTMRSFLINRSYNYMETDMMAEFFAVNNPTAPVDLITFFDQWVKKPGHPIYSIAPRLKQENNGTYNLDINLKQIQNTIEGRREGVPDVFITPLELRVFRDSIGNYESINLISDKIEQSVSKNIDFVPVKIEINLLKTMCDYSVDSLITGIESDNDQIIVENNGANKLLISNVKADSYFNLYDMNGNKAFEKQILIGNLHSIDLEKMTQGMYFYTISNNKSTLSGKVLKSE